MIMYQSYIPLWGRPDKRTCALMPAIKIEAFSRVIFAGQERYAPDKLFLMEKNLTQSGFNIWGKMFNYDRKMKLA